MQLASLASKRMLRALSLLLVLLPAAMPAWAGKDLDKFMKYMERVNKVQNINCPVTYRDYIPESKAGWKAACQAAYSAYCGNDHAEAQRNCNLLSVGGQDENCSVCQRL